jgi:hypothetical protein
MAISKAGSSFGRGSVMGKSPKDYGLSWDPKLQAICQAVGYYLYMYGLIELIIGTFLAHVLGFDRDNEKLDLLISGLDARGKISRLIEAGQRYNKPIGPNLTALLNDFGKRDVNLRNLMSHTYPILDDKDVIHFTSVGATNNPFPTTLPNKPLALKPPRRSLKEIYERVTWLLRLRHEMLQIGRIASSLSELEVDPTKLSLPSALPKPRKANPHTIPDRRSRKDHRKTLRKAPLK